MLEDIKLYNLKGSLVNEKVLYAHIDNKNDLEYVKDPELISEHSQRTIDFFYKLGKYKGIDEILYNIISNLKLNGQKIDEEAAKLIMELYVNAIYLHDIGKINPAFQFKKMKNSNIEFENTSATSDSNHSIFSSLMYIDIFIDKVQQFQDRKTKNFLKYVLLSFAFVISRHHTYLTNFGEVDFLDELESIQERIRENPSYLKYYKNSQRIINDLSFNLFKNISNDKDEGFEFYILVRLLYSSIVSCDFYATYYYDTGNEPEFKFIDNVDDILKVYKNTDIYKGISEYKKNKNFFGSKSINTLRSEMFLEAEDSLLRNVDKHNIFYLEAPTGSGKTNTSINLALNIVKQIPKYNSILYIFPFNTLVEQTKGTFDGIFNSEMQNRFRVAVVNSITPIVTQSEKSGQDEETIDYKKDYLNRQMLQYPVSITTHINFFNYLFGTGREINLPLIHLCNSIIIIDEVQSYRNRIWPEIIKFLNYYSKLLNFKIIIMSATLPKLDKLLDGNNHEFYELIHDKDKYYQNDLFKNRVKLNFGLFSKEKFSLDDLLEKVDEVVNKRKEARILIEFISKKTARDFFNQLKLKYPNKKIYEITGDDSNFIRKQILKDINSVDEDKNFIYKDIIVVATQVIEAGVDIDMDIGFKDISLLDGEEQFLGRINRSCKRGNCEAFFFNLDAAENVYREDFRLEFDLRNKEYQDYLRSKDFEGFYNNCFKRLHDNKSENNSNNIKNLDENVLYLNFEKVSNQMKLIIDENYQLYLAHEIKDEETGEIINGANIWEKYKELIANKDMDYSKRKIELSKLALQMSYFTYNYKDYDSKTDKTPKLSNDNIGRLYYIEDGQRYITEDGKFDRKKYIDDSGGLFL